MTRWRFWLLLTVCGWTVLAHSQQPAAPHRGQTLKDIQNFLVQKDGKTCQERLDAAEQLAQARQQWYEENKPIHDAVMERNRELETRVGFEERNLSFGFMAGAGGVGVLCIVVAVNRKRLIPKSVRGKQISVLLPAALWCSFCFVGIASDSDLMRHPINAAVTAMLWASPALLFGGILLWWFSPRSSAPQLPEKPLI